MRKTGATRVRGLFSGDSHTASYSALKAPNTAPLKRLPTERREHQEKQPHNDNEEQNQNRRRAKRTPKKKIAARVASYFRQLEAVAGNYEVYVFTARIHAPLLEGRQARKNPTTWMQHRIARELKDRLGRSVPFAAVMEWRTEGRPELHCHGAIPLAPGEKQRASEALRVAGGPWRHSRAPRGKSRSNFRTPTSPLRAHSASTDGRSTAPTTSARRSSNWIAGARLSTRSDGISGRRISSCKPAFSTAGVFETDRLLRFATNHAGRFETA